MIFLNELAQNNHLSNCNFMLHLLKHIIHRGGGRKRSAKELYLVHCCLFKAFAFILASNFMSIAKRIHIKGLELSVSVSKYHHTFGSVIAYICKHPIQSDVCDCLFFSSLVLGITSAI